MNTVSDIEETQNDASGLPANYAPLALEKEIREFWQKLKSAKNWSF